jgi:RNA polymerase sigma-70 factor, ECF subfamily
MLKARFKLQRDLDNQGASALAQSEPLDAGLEQADLVGAELADERELVERAKAGEAQAQGALFDQYWPKVVRYAYAHCGNAQDAEDVASEVFLRMVEAIDRFQWRDGVPFAAWLFRIARNQVVSHHRKRTLHLPLIEGAIDEPATRGDPQEVTELRMTVDEVYRLTAQLPNAEQEVVWLRFAADLSVADTAKALNKKENNVKQLQHKAIIRIKQLFDGAE